MSSRDCHSIMKTQTVSAIEIVAIKTVASCRVFSFTTCAFLPGRPVNVFRLGIWKEVKQTGHLMLVFSCLLTKFASLSRHAKQNECKQGRVLGSLSVSKHSGHSASFLRFLKSCRTSMFAGEFAGRWLD